MRVLDFSQQLPGPYATEMLAALGADVIKVEPPAGDPARDLDAVMFTRVNGRKRSVRLNLKTERDRGTALALMAGADVVVEGFRPGVVARLGIDYSSAQAINARVVYCSISGFGQEGPLSRKPTHDVSLQALAGALPPDVLHSHIGVPWVDLATGTTAAMLIVAVWQDGKGGYIDAAMMDAAVAWTQVKPEAVTSLEPTYGTLRTLDGQTAVVALLEDAMWKRLCEALGWADWMSDGTLSRYSDRRTRARLIRDRLEDTVSRMSSAELTRRAEAFDLPIEVVSPGAGEFAEQLVHRQAGDARHARVPVPAAWQSGFEAGSSS